MSENTEVVNSLEGEISKDGGGILTFYIEDQIYGIEIKYITDIIEIQPITAVPKVPQFIKGVFNLRGKVIPVMSIRERFGIEQIPFDSRTCIVVVDIDDVSVGIIIDKVCEVFNVSSTDITPPPTFKSVNANQFIAHIVNAKDHVKLILDCRKLIFD